MRKYDIVILGATGFTGSLVAEYLVARGLGNIRLALAGRDRNKLEQLRRSLAQIDPAAAQLPLVLADSFNRASLDALAASTKVLCTTVGPYAKYGEQTVAACATHGTHYCDITGEPQFVRRMIDRYDAVARATGARIVNCCGFDSIPSDIGVFMLYRAFQERGGQLQRVRNFLGNARGGIGGGTIASGLNLISEACQDTEVREVMSNPYSLYPRGEQPGLDGRDQMGVRRDADIGAWTAPFVMAAINGKIVRRSNALLGFVYGRQFRYSESMRMGAGLGGALSAAMISASVGLGTAAMAIGPLRRMAERRMPKPGSGPNQAKRERGHFGFELIGDGFDAQGAPLQMHGRIGGAVDPGYTGTAMMLGESALSLAFDELHAPGGVRTPASTMGDMLLERLCHAGMSFSVSLATRRDRRPQDADPDQRREIDTQPEPQVVECTVIATEILVADLQPEHTPQGLHCDSMPESVYGRPVSRSSVDSPEYEAWSIEDPDDMRAKTNPDPHIK
jgi:short subunit dehydrogenase-like uncharacterized protein